MTDIYRLLYSPAVPTLPVSIVPSIGRSIGISVFVRKEHLLRAMQELDDGHCGNVSLRGFHQDADLLNTFAQIFSAKGSCQEEYSTQGAVQDAIRDPYSMGIVVGCVLISPAGPAAEISDDPDSRPPLTLEVVDVTRCVSLQQLAPYLPSS